jgi:acetyltransferase
VPSAAIAQAVVPVIAASGRNVFTCWLGGEAVAEAKGICSQAGIPTYETPEDAVQGFHQIVQYRCNQELLMQAPAAIESDAEPDKEAARAIIEGALGSGRDVLTADEATSLLAVYKIPVAQLRKAETPAQAAECAREMGFPVAVKIMSPDISHKSDVGGVKLELQNAEEVRQAANDMQVAIAAKKPEARLEGFFIQAMATRRDAVELIIGVSTDPLFGPVILFGRGGTSVEVVKDKAIALPPLNSVLSKDLVERTQVSKVLAGYRNIGAADMKAIHHCLLQISSLVVDFPQIAELDINPLLADHEGVLALDARVRLSALDRLGSNPRMAICPYPRELEEVVTWGGNTLVLRPIKPEDSGAHVNFFRQLTPEDIRYRMFVGIHELPPAMLARFTQIDYDREMAFIAIRNREILGVARMVADPDREAAEFAVIVRSDLKRQGLGTILMSKLISYCRHAGIGKLYGEALPDNTNMLNLATHLQFNVRRSTDGDTARMEMDLDSTPSLLAQEN